MKIENQNYLFKQYPSMFAGTKKSPMESCMAFGIECGDGWFDIIKNTCEKLNEYILYNDIAFFEFTQIKEKYGSLRMYASGGDDITESILEIAENESYDVCEVCGSKENVRICGKSWLKNLCKKCEKV